MGCSCLARVEFSKSLKKTESALAFCGAEWAQIAERVRGSNKQ